MLKKLLKESPVFLQKPIMYLYNCIPYERKLTKTFKETYDFVQESQWWTEEQHRAYQLDQLKKLIMHAYYNVPYYRRVFDERGLRPGDIKSFEDLKKLPYLTKDIIRENMEELRALNYKKEDLRIITTGGTTGIPMRFYGTRKEILHREWGFISSFLTCFGYKPFRRSRMVLFRGFLPLEGCYEKRGLELILSSFDLTEENIKKYLELIVGFKPDFIRAYPSSIVLLSRYILQNNIDVNIESLKAIICSSENLFSKDKQIIEKAFHKNVYCLYGHSEKSCMGWECKDTRHYHMISEYGYTELINRDGLDAVKEDEIGEIVCTGFNNYAFPFIRYRTGDMGVNTNKKCGCGMAHKMIKRIEGRKQDFFVGDDSQLLSIIYSDEAVYSIGKKLLSYQYVQHEPGKVILNIVSKTPLNEDESAEIKELFQKRYQGLDIEVQEVENIERTKSGKYKFLIQNIKVVF